MNDIINIANAQMIGVCLQLLATGTVFMTFSRTGILAELTAPAFDRSLPDLPPSMDTALQEGQHVKSAVDLASPGLVPDISFGNRGMPQPHPASVPGEYNG